MADWRVAYSLDRLRDQIDAIAPGRDRSSDGSIGDPAHAADPTSDHNPRRIPGTGPKPLVLARDFDHDPAHGADMGAIAERIRLSRDPRVAYVIHSGRFYSSITQPWKWRPYTGVNNHKSHMHVSALRDKIADDRRDWDIMATVSPQDEALKRPTDDPKRTLGWHYADMQNLRDWMYGAPGKKGADDPGPESRIALILKAATEDPGQTVFVLGDEDRAAILAEVRAAATEAFSEVLTRLRIEFKTE